jgi:hypothetical protein
VKPNANLERLNISREYGYRQLSCSDAPQLKALLTVFGSAFNEASTYESAIPTDEYLQSLLVKTTFPCTRGVTWWRGDRRNSRIRIG